tara:strand:- start:295 stop:555 length:261 start_codon:yes stop_codon:yes gene_type:complete
MYKFYLCVVDLNKEMPNQGYCIPYNPSEQSEIINNLINELVDIFHINRNKLLFHCKRTYDIKTGVKKGAYPGIKEYIIFVNINLLI